MADDNDKKKLDPERLAGEVGEDEEKIPYPKSVFFILSTEACERFSYYGMRAILSLYLKHLFVQDGMESGQAEDVSTILYHAFVFLSYFTSLFGAFLADSFLGKFKTIFYISIVYAIGQCILAFGAVPSSEEADGIEGLPQQAISYIGLVLIGFGTGGIKPCVVSFGADQFTLPQQKEEMSTFFGIFYASINFGSMISTILTPIFRRQPCFGEEECYTLAFGVPAALMVVAIIFFVMGRPGYKITVPDQNVVLDFFKCMWEGFTKKRQSTEKRDHWLDYATERFGKVFVADIKAVLRVCVLFTMYPLFWALYDQQGSRWTFQATRMDGEIGPIIILPDQMQVINAVLILVFIPIFDKILYPLCAKCNMLKTPLQKIITGGTLVAIAFVVSGCVELVLEKTYPHPPEEKQARLAFHNSYGPNCLADVIVTDIPHADIAINDIKNGMSKAYVDPGNDDYELLPFEFKGSIAASAMVTVKSDGSGVCGLAGSTKTVPITIMEEFGHTVWLLPDDNGAMDAYVGHTTDEVQKSDSGYPFFRFFYDLDGIAEGDTIVVSGEDYVRTDERPKDYAVMHEVAAMPMARNDTEGYEGKDQGTMKICIEGYQYGSDPNSEEYVEMCAVDSAGKKIEYKFQYGGSYNIFMNIESINNEDQLVAEIIEVTEHNSMHMMWLLPQYIILTAGEVLFSITSLAFSFTQAPESMKAVLQALYLLTTALGNLIDLVVVASLSSLFSSQAHEFFLFAGLMFLDMLALAFLAKRYTYVDYTNGRPDDLGSEISHDDVKPGAEDKNVTVARRRSSLS